MFLALVGEQKRSVGNRLDTWFETAYVAQHALHKRVLNQSDTVHQIPCQLNSDLCKHAVNLIPVSLSLCDTIVINSPRDHALTALVAEL